MIAAAGMSRDALDAGRQIAIALRHHARQPVHPLRRLRRRLDLDPAANAFEDSFRIERIDCRQHGVASNPMYVIGARADARPGMTAYSRLRGLSNQNHQAQRLSGPSRAAICSTSSTMLRRSLASGMRVKARVSARPSEVARKSET